MAQQMFNKFLSSSKHRSFLQLFSDDRFRFSLRRLAEEGRLIEVNSNAPLIFTSLACIVYFSLYIHSNLTLLLHIIGAVSVQFQPSEVIARQHEDVARIIIIYKGSVEAWYSTRPRLAHTGHSKYRRPQSDDSVLVCSHHDGDVLGLVRLPIACALHS